MKISSFSALSVADITQITKNQYKTWKVYCFLLGKSVGHIMYFKVCSVGTMVHTRNFVPRICKPDVGTTLV